jgi:hypothetical protein
MGLQNGSIRRPMKVAQGTLGRLWDDEINIRDRMIGRIPMG